MTKVALHSRLGAAVMNYRHSLGQTPTPEDIMKMSDLAMANELKINDEWDRFYEHYGVVQVEFDFYDRDGKIE